MMRVDVPLDGGSVPADVAAAPVLTAGGAVLRGDAIRVRASAPVVGFYRHGWHSWSPTRWLDPAAPVAPVTAAELRLTADDPVHAGSTRHGGSGLGAVELDGGQVLLLGALGLGARVELDGDRLVGTTEVAGTEWFLGRGSEAAVFARYAELVGERLGRRERPAPRMWSSWYSLAGEIDEPILHDVLAQLRGLDGLELDLVQVDDGWQAEIGDWQANARFPSGMAALADAVHRAGWEPGLWLAPFIASERAPLTSEHPEALVGAPDGGGPALAGWNWGGRYHGLDLTHPVARDHVAAAIERAVGWGYGYLKLDFLYAAALPGRRREDVPREVAYRRGVELVREVAGDDVYLLGCGAPIIPSLGVFDGLRVGPDVAPWWEQVAVTRHLHDLAGPATRYAIASSLQRLWLRPLVAVDPDVAYLSAAGNALTAAQRGLLADLCRIAGFRATSDLPARLHPDERAGYAAFFAGAPAVERLDRARFRVDGREVDFTPVLGEPDLR